MYEAIACWAQNDFSLDIFHHPVNNLREVFSFIPRLVNLVQPEDTKDPCSRLPWSP